MTPIVRSYASETQARDSIRSLREAGFADSALRLVTPAVDGSPQNLEAEHEALPRECVDSCKRSLAAGNSLVFVSAPFGTGETATRLLQQHSPLDIDHAADSSRSDVGLSGFLGIPTLTRAGFRPLLPLDELSEIGTLSEPMHDPAPLSSLLGMKLLSAPKRAWKRSFGLPLTSDNAGPLSSSVGMRTLTSSRSKESSMGLPLISKNPTPLSSLLGIPVLTRRRKRR